MMAEKTGGMQVTKPAPHDGLPEEHVPESLRAPVPAPRTQVAYACGYEQKWAGDVIKCTYAMWAGPWPDLKTALDSVPPDDSLGAKMQYKDACIVRFNLDGTDEVVYRWFKPRTGPGMWKRAT